MKLWLCDVKRREFFKLEHGYGGFTIYHLLHLAYSGFGYSKELLLLPGKGLEEGAWNLSFAIKRTYWSLIIHS